MAAMLRAVAPCVHVARRSATPADASYLRALFAESRDDLLVLPPDVRELMLDMQYVARRRQLAADHPGASREVLVADDSDAGLLVVDSDETAVCVIDLVIASAQRRRGIASLTLESVIADAGTRPVRVKVSSENTGAVALYRGLGFAATLPTDGCRLSMERPAGRH